MTSMKSMVDVAYDIMAKKKRGVTFARLWKEVASKKAGEASEEGMAQFYTDLSLDARFTALKGNKWDLKERHTFEETYVSLEELDADEDEEEEMDEELTEEDENDLNKIDEEY